MKWLILFLLVIVSVSAHEVQDQEHMQEHELYDSQYAYASTNSFDGVNPFLLISQGKFGQAAFASLIWFGLLAGLWQLVKMVLGRVLLIQE